MFAYCGNNPVKRLDVNGLFWSELADWLGEVWEEIKESASNTFGASKTSSVILYESETPIIPDPAPITITKGTNSTKTVSSCGDSSKPISVYADGVINAPVESSSAGIYINVDDFTLDISAACDDIGVKGSVNNGNTTSSFGLTLNISRAKVGIEHSVSTTMGNITSTNYTNVSVNGWFLIAAYLFLVTGQEVPYPPAIPSPVP